MTPRAERKDTGRYTLRLKNDSGVVEADINVTVLGVCVRDDAPRLASSMFEMGIHLMLKQLWPTFIMYSCIVETVK